MWASAAILPARIDRQQRFHIDAGRLEQGLDQQPVLIEQGRAVELPALVGGEPADQREAVGMDARGGEAEDDVAGLDLVAGQRLAALDRADAEAGEVVIALARTCPASRPSRRRSARSRPAGSPRRSTAITRSAMPGSSFAGGEIVEEEERLGALDDEIVGAHRDEVDADAVVAAAVDGELQLGADAVIGGDQQRIAIAGRLEVEEAAEPAERRRPRRAARSPWRAARSPSPARCRRRCRRPPWRRCSVSSLAHQRRLATTPLGFPRPTRQKTPREARPPPARHRDSARRRAARWSAAGVLYAQLEGADRGIPPIDSTSNFEVLGRRGRRRAPTTPRRRGSRAGAAPRRWAGRCSGRAPTGRPLGAGAQPVRIRC